MTTHYDNCDQIKSAILCNTLQCIVKHVHTWALVGIFLEGANFQEIKYANSLPVFCNFFVIFAHCLSFLPCPYLQTPGGQTPI